MEVENDEEGSEIMSAIIDHGLKTGDFNEPSLTARLSDFLKRNPDKPVKPKKVSFQTRPAVEKKKRKVRERVRRVKGLSRSISASSGSSSGEEIDFLLLGKNKEEDDRPVIKSSIPYMPLEDDTPIFDHDILLGEDDLPCETSEEAELLLQLEKLSISQKDKQLQAEKLDALVEIEQDLKRLPQLDERIRNDAWRSFFMLSNTTDNVTEEDLTLLLQSLLCREA